MTKSLSTSEDSDDEGEGEQNNNIRLSIPDPTSDLPRLPPTSSSRGDCLNQKEKLVSTSGIHAGREDEQQRPVSDAETLQATEPPPKLYLSSNPNERRTRPSIPESSSRPISDPNDSIEYAPRTIASAILGKQTKLGNNDVTDVQQNNSNVGVVPSTLKESNRPSNTGAFAIAGPQAETTTRGATQVESSETIGPEETTSDGNNNMIHAEIAPDVEGMIQERLQAIQQDRDDAIIVAVATNENGENNDASGMSNKDVPGFQWTGRNKLVFILSLVCFAVLVAGVTGGIMASSMAEPQEQQLPQSSDEIISTAPSASASEALTTMPTTTRQGIIVASLVGDGSDIDYVLDPLSHPEAFQWLSETDIWIPPSSATDPQGLWRERYSMAVFFFATSGGDDLWLDRRNWLSATSSVCEWDCCGAEFGDNMEILCSQDGKIQSLTTRQYRLVGTIPSEIKALSMLELIDFSGNFLRGSLPSTLGLLSRLTQIELHTNQFVGSLPSYLGNLVNLQNLQLHQTALTGQLPSEVGKWSSLHSVSLYDNIFRGTIPKEISQWTNLHYINLSANQFSGPLPSEIGNWTQLQWFFLSSNTLTGTLPTSLGLLTNLQDLVLGNNLFGGPIPTELGMLTRLSTLILGINDLSGQLPTELLRLSSTYIFDVSYNDLTGDIPSFPFANSSRIFCVDGNQFSTDMGNQNGRDCRA